MIGSDVKSNNIQTIINIHPLAMYLTTAPWFSVVVPILQFILTASCNGIPPSSKWWLPEHGRAVRKNTRESKNGRMKLIQLHMYQGSPLFPILHDLSRTHHVHSVCCPWPPSHHPSSLTAVPLVPARHLLLLLLLLKKIGNARSGEGDRHPISPKTSAPTLPTYRGKEEKGKIVED